MGNLCASPGHVDEPVPTKLEDLYTLQEELGSGAYSTVYAATNKRTGQRVAVKVIDRKNVSAADEKSLLREVTIMKTLHHPNIVQLYDFYSEPERLCLVIELLDGGELFDRIVKRKAYNESVARDAIRNVLTGLKYMHDLDVAHRDLKPENLLLARKDDDSDLKIADFGFARCDASAMVTQCGTPNYVAPEVLIGGSSAYTKAVDMWSMGIIIFIILGGYPPFQHKNQAKLFHKIKRGNFEFHEKYWSHISPEAKDLIRQLLELNTHKRLTATQALEHPWFKTEAKILSSNNLQENQAELKKNQGLSKFRTAVHMVILIERLSKLGAKPNIEQAQNLIQEGILEGDEDEEDDDEDSAGDNVSKDVLAALEPTPSEANIPTYPSIPLTDVTSMVPSTSSDSIRHQEHTPRDENEDGNETKINEVNLSFEFQSK